MRLTFEPLTRADLAELAETMRPIDRLEARAMSGGQPLPDVLDGLLRNSRRARAARIDGRLVMCFGLIRRTILIDTGHPWALGTGEMQAPEARRAFIQHGREQLAWTLQDVSACWNAVHAENRDAIRWLKWMGFAFDDTQYIVGGEPFLRFSMET